MVELVIFTPADEVKLTGRANLSFSGQAERNKLIAAGLLEQDFDEAGTVTEERLVVHPRPGESFALFRMKGRTQQQVHTTVRLVAAMDAFGLEVPLDKADEVGEILQEMAEIARDGVQLDEAPAGIRLLQRLSVLFR